MADSRTVRIDIGYTHAVRCGEDYIPSMDGYRPGAEQTVVTLEVDRTGFEGVDGQHWADAVFIATNAPSEAIRADTAAWRIQEAIEALVARSAVSGGTVFMRSLSVGDTVTVDRRRWECMRLGWRLPLPTEVTGEPSGGDGGR